MHCLLLIPKGRPPFFFCFTLLDFRSWPHLFFVLKFYFDDCWRTGWNGPNDVLEMTISRCFIIFSDICQLRLDFDNFDIVETTTGCVISTPFPLYFLVLGCWELSNMIFLMLREKELLVNLSNFTTWQLFSPKTTT